MYQLGLLVLCALSVLATADEETTCQSHRRNAAGSGALMQWDIKCDNTTGKYEPLQCTVQTNPQWCACYNEEEAITQPSRGIKTCECYLARDRAIKAGGGDSDCSTPQCQRSGKFEKKQCCESRNGIQCHCVDENTGEETGTTGGIDLQCP